MGQPSNSLLILGFPFFDYVTLVLPNTGPPAPAWMTALSPIFVKDASAPPTDSELGSQYRVQQDDSDVTFSFKFVVPRILFLKKPTPTELEGTFLLSLTIFRYRKPCVEIDRSTYLEFLPFLPIREFPHARIRSFAKPSPQLNSFPTYRNTPPHVKSLG